MNAGALLVTGASGRLGSALLDVAGVGRLRERFPEIRLLLRATPATRAPESLRRIAGDLLAPSTLEPALRGVDTVLHLAALTHSHSTRAYDATNRVGTLHLLEACRTAGVERIVFMSSRAAHPDGGAYARSKWLAEAAVVESGLRRAVLCPAEAYGAGSGDAIEGLVEQIRTRRVVPLPGRGLSRLAPVDARDVGAATLEAVLRSEASGRFVLAGPEDFSYRDLVLRLAGWLGRRPLLVPVPWTALRGAALLARLTGSGRLTADQIPRLRIAKPTDSSAAARALGFRPRRLEEGLADRLGDVRPGGPSAREG